MKTLFFCLVWALWFVTASRAHSQAFSFTTLAGSISSGSTDGTGAAARFAGPSGVAADSQGNLYVTDSGNNTIRKITTGGTVTTIAGQIGVKGSTDAMGTNASFNLPTGIAVDTNGNLYVADEFNDTIRKITPMGTNWMVSTLAGQVTNAGLIDAMGTNAQFATPTGVAVDSAGNVYVADVANDVIRQITPAGFVSTIAGQPHHPGHTDGTNNGAQFYMPFGITVDATTNLYVTDGINETVRKIVPIDVGWAVSTIAGQVLVSGSADGVGTNAQFNGPAGIAISGGSTLYVADDNNNTIRKLTLTGTNWTVSTLAGLVGVYGDADGATNNALFYFPRGLAVDNGSNVYVADSENNSIRELSPVGTNWLVTTVAGVASIRANDDGTGTNAHFFFPDDVTFDTAGHLYVMDTYNQTIRKMTLAGTNRVVTTVAGQIGVTGSTDGIGTNAVFNYAQSLAFDGAGNLYVADTHNSTIRFGRAIIPSLQIAPAANNQVTLSWPAWAYSFLLETSGTVSPGAVWTPLTNGVLTLGNNFVLTNSVGGSNAFYRLQD